MNKVYGGTPKHGGSNLCTTCRSAHIIKGQGMTEVTLCRVGGCEPLTIRQPVVACNEYEDKSAPTLYQMEKVAWKFSVDNSNRPVGFLSPKRWKEKHGDDD